LLAFSLSNEIDMKKLLLLPIFLFALQISSFAQERWNNAGSGSTIPVNTLAADTTNKILYAGGIFTQTGGLPAIGVAKWDGVSYTSLGSGILSGSGLNALLVMPNGDLIAGGTFTSIGGVQAKNIARWNGTGWAPIGLGLSNLFGISGVRTLALYNNELYAGGIFALSGFTPLGYIARWNGTNWVQLGSGTNGQVLSMAVYNNELYVGGTFTNAGGVSVHNIAKWDGTHWHDVGGGCNYTGAITVSALQVYSGGLYAGGAFSSAGSTPVNNIAKWDGANWSDPGGGTDYTGAITVSALQVFKGELVAAGSFDSLGSKGANFIGKWDGTSWSEMGTGMNNSVYALASLGDTLYAGGLFTSAGGESTPFIAEWVSSSSLARAMSVNKMNDGTDQFDVFPNPSQNNVWIRNNSKSQNAVCSFVLQDALGREVARADNFKQVLNFERKNISAGLYFYKILNAENVSVQEGKILFTE
jgi:hypothetical protein